MQSILLLSKNHTIKAIRRLVADSLADNGSDATLFWTQPGGWIRSGVLKGACGTEIIDNSHFILVCGWSTKLKTQQ